MGAKLFSCNEGLKWEAALFLSPSPRTFLSFSSHGILGNSSTTQCGEEGTGSTLYYFNDAYWIYADHIHCKLHSMQYAVFYSEGDMSKWSLNTLRHESSITLRCLNPRSYVQTSLRGHSMLLQFYCIFTYLLHLSS